MVGRGRRRRRRGAVRGGARARRAAPAAAAVARRLARVHLRPVLRDINIHAIILPSYVQRLYIVGICTDNLMSGHSVFV